MVQINSDPDTGKVPVSDPHFVGTPVKVTCSGRVSKPCERLNCSSFSLFLSSCVLG